MPREASMPLKSLLLYSPLPLSQRNRKILKLRAFIDSSNVMKAEEHNSDLVPGRRKISVHLV